MKSAGMGEEDPIVRIRRRLQEMRTRVLSSVKVTNPVNGVPFLDIHDNQVLILDKNGATLLDAADPPYWGYRNPWQNYQAFPSTPVAISNALSGALQITAQATLYPNQARIKITSSVQAKSTSGGIADYQISYTVNGGSPVVIPGSSGSTSSTATVSVEYVWPADYFNSRIQIRWQACIRVGTGNATLDSAVFAPTRLYGAPA